MSFLMRMAAASVSDFPQAARLRRELAAWFDREQRRLPWRTERSVYRTVVSEFMLQQTQVVTVLPYFERWLRSFPDFKALAAASEEQVLKHWEGLGYYRRARFLLKLARAVVNLAALPTTAAAWQELPGIGPYTAAAIASISFDDPVACVDGNVVRILARLSATNLTFADGSRAVAHFQSSAQALLDRQNPGRHNEAMMELGATICVRRNPLCDRCPVASHCKARKLGLVNELPRISRPTTIAEEVDRVWVEADGRLLMHRAPDGGRRLRGLLELPRAVDVDANQKALAGGTVLATKRRTITRHRITETIHRIEPQTLPDFSRQPDLMWVAFADLETAALSGPHRRWITEILTSWDR